MRIVWTLLIAAVSFYFYQTHATSIFVEYSTKNFKKLPRFWTNTGFSPPEPLEEVSDFLDSDDLKLNLEIIGSMPNK